MFKIGNLYVEEMDNIPLPYRIWKPTNLKSLEEVREGFHYCHRIIDDVVYESYFTNSLPVITQKIHVAFKEFQLSLFDLLEEESEEE